MQDETSLPDNVKALNFTTEQLPVNTEALPEAAPEVKLAVLDPKEGGVPTEVKVDDKPVVKEVPKDKPVAKEEPVKGDGPEGELIDDKKKDDKEVKEEGARRFLKPPKGAEVKAGDKSTPQAGDVDLKKYAPQEQTILKNMSVQSRRFVADLMDKNKELAKAKDGQWFQHPNAYVLHPQFSEARETVKLAETEAAHWAEQLEKAKAGEDVIPLLRFDEKGEPVFGNPIKASGQVEEQLRQALSSCNQVASQKKIELGNMKKNFKQAMDNDLAIINQERELRFEWVKDPTLLNYSLTVQDGKGGTMEKTIDQVRKDVVSLFPPYMKDHPAVHTSSDLMVALLIARAELEEANNNKQVATIKKDEEKQVEPSSEHRKEESKPTGKFGGVKNFTIEGAGVEV